MKTFVVWRDHMSEGHCYECNGGGDFDVKIVKARSLEALIKRIERRDIIALPETHWQSDCQVVAAEITEAWRQTFKAPPKPPPKPNDEDYGDSLLTDTLKAYTRTMRETVLAAKPLIFFTPGAPATEQRWDLLYGNDGSPGEGADETSEGFVE